MKGKDCHHTNLDSSLKIVHRELLSVFFKMLVQDDLEILTAQYHVNFINCIRHAAIDQGIVIYDFDLSPVIWHEDDGAGLYHFSYGYAERFILAATDAEAMFCY